MRKIFDVVIHSSIVSNITRMWQYIRPYKWRALAAILITIPVGLMDAVIAWSLKPYMDIVVLEKPSGYVLYLPMAVILMGLLQGLFNYLAGYWNTWVGRKIADDVKLTLFDKLMKNDSEFFDRETSGNIQSRFNYDVDSACSSLILNLKVFMVRVVSSISLIAVLIYNSWVLAIIAVVVLAGALFPVSQIRKKIEQLLNKTVSSSAIVSTHYNETFNGNRVITSYNLYQYQKHRFQKTLNSVFKLSMKMTQKMGLVTPMMNVIISIGIAGVIWTGSYLILSKQITAGNFVSFMTALIMLYTPIKGLGNNHNTMQMALLAMERLWDMLDKVPSIVNKRNAIDLVEIKSSIEYRDVSFSYTAEHPVLHNCNLIVNVGQTVALVGNSGGGKSTFANLLPRFYDVTSGAILIDGVDIRDFDLESLRSKIAVVFQDNFLFAGTIRENIALGRENISEDELQQVLYNACLHEFISSLPCGLETNIGERGILLSGGQRQRVGIARAFLKNAPIVILDEATSALDNKSESIVQQAITNLTQNRTVFIIAHRLSTIRHADKIVVISHGKIVDQGTHDQLLRKTHGEYALLYNMESL